METTPVLDLLQRFADAMETDGIAAVPAELLTGIVDVARSVDASPIALGVLLDPTEPPWCVSGPTEGSPSRSSVGRRRSAPAYGRSSTSAH